MTPEQLEAIKKRAENATEGPWKYNSQFGYLAPITPQRQIAVICNEITSDYDADFIAHSREDIPALLAEVYHLRALLRQRDRQLAGERKGSQRTMAENERYRQALLRIAAGDTWTQYCYDIAKEALRK